MTNLPAHIEAYLLEAGFTTTEILVLKRLMEGTHTTLRELAAKTGKSTGVLDQATKKLMRKKILTKELINGSPRYMLTSVDGIAKWVKEDVRQKRETLKRKQENFESFIATLKSDITRPDMEYFDGEEGIKRAYAKLLDCSSDLLCYKPVTRKEEDEPLRAFFVEYFRERRRRGVFLRVISHNTPLGRRYRSRDPFEYRETLLVPEDAYQFTFEKIICGDIVACINHEEQKACFIRFPELAESERTTFEMIWAQEKQRAGADLPTPRLSEHERGISISTRTLSSLREFLISRKSLATFAVLGVLSAAITYGLYRHNVALNLARIQNQVMGIAATGALQFDPADLEEIYTVDDIEKPEYAKIIGQLNAIRDQNEGIKYVYLLRPTHDPFLFSFIADADALDPFTVIDVNNDGVIDTMDHLSPPGEIYFDASGDPFNTENVSFYSPATDQWGTVVVGSAPIKVDGITVALLGIDRKASDIFILARETFAPIYWFIGIFLLFVFIRLAAFNRSLLKDLLRIARTKSVRTALLMGVAASLVFVVAMYSYTYFVIKDEIGQRLMAIAATAASQIDPRDLEMLHFARDMHSDEYQRVFDQLNEIRNNNANIKYVYIFRPKELPHTWEFIADADSHPSLPYWVDENEDGIMQPEELAAFPGKAYFSMYPKKMNSALHSPVYENNYVHDQWGTFISAYAPIKNKSDTIGVLGVDMDVSEVYEASKNKFFPATLFILVLIITLLLRWIR